jgi:hypothetical protein
MVTVPSVAVLTLQLPADPPVPPSLLTTGSVTDVPSGQLTVTWLPLCLTEHEPELPESSPQPTQIASAISAKVEARPRAREQKTDSRASRVSA